LKDSLQKGVIWLFPPSTIFGLTPDLPTFDEYPTPHPPYPLLSTQFLTVKIK